MRENRHGFILLEQKEIEEVKGIGALWEHEKSGARLFHISSEDDNKVFSVSFRTPPADDTGLPHILEHSVLCGSRKFPLKEPFVELVKGSLNTFLNAMTFPDKTMYPVASRNDQDFKNLVDVYLDAVFFPNIHNNPWTLKQEGWHYELDSLDGELTYNGVVYNEMKGVFSSPDALLEQEIFATLFPDTPYGKESGGDPEKIPQLTQADFEKFHQTYYHPSNSFFYLYGDMNLDEYLQFFNEEYLGKFEKEKINSEIERQASFASPKEAMIEYPISEEDDPEGKTIFTLNWVTDTEQDITLAMGLDLLCHILLETSASPLRKALQDAGIAKEISGDFQDSLLQPVFSVTATFGKKEKKEEFVQVIFDTLKKLAAEGLSRDLVMASLHRQEFALREGVTGSTPKGLIYGIRCMNTWLYEKDPADSLQYEVALKSIKEGVERGFFENLIQRFLLENSHQALVWALPSPGLLERKEKENVQKLSELKASFSKEELEVIISETEELNLRQETPDPIENLNTIPLLKRSDMKREADFPEWKETALSNQSVLLEQQLFTGKILYFSLSFDGKKIPQEDLGYFHLLSYLLGKVSTENYHYEDLSNKVNQRSGGMSFSLYGWGKKGEENSFNPRFTLKTKALSEDISSLTQLIQEILTRSRFDEEKRIRDLISESRARMESSMSDAGQQIAIGRINAMLSAQGAYNYYGQLPLYQFIKNLDENFEDEKTTLFEKLKEVYGKIFSTENLVINVTGDQEELEIWKSLIPGLLNSLFKESFVQEEYKFPILPKTEGIFTSSKVQYVVQGFNYRKLGQEFNGIYKVMETILRYDYLWNRIRVQGGAYGAAARFERNGGAIFSSYRDPNLAETLEVYQGIGNYLRNFAPDEREMTKYVIGTVSGLDTPLTPSMKSDLVLSAYFSEVTAEDIQRERIQVLEVTAEQIRETASWIDQGIEENMYCIFGNEDKIKTEKGRFERIISATDNK